MSHIPKAVLYYSPISVWSSVARLALEEKGYGEDELDFRIVDLAKGENFSPTYLRLNINGTVPTLVVPIETTLSNDIESRYKALTLTTAIVDFLDKSRSALSRTNTTSKAPAPSLAPATIAFASASKGFVELLHSEQCDPTQLMYYNAYDQVSLRTLSAQLLPAVSEKQRTLTKLISDRQNGSIQVSEKVAAFWQRKLDECQSLLKVIEGKEKAAVEKYLETSTKRWGNELKSAIIELSKDFTGPFVFGEQISTADLHLAGWLTRIFYLVGVEIADNGKSALEKLSRRIQGGLAELGEEPKLATFWDTVKERPAWKKVYKDGLH